MVKDYKTDKGKVDENFCRDVYEIVKNIPEGKVCTYGIIARLIGKPQASRMVGRALKHLPESVNLPCHRVVNATGRLVPGWNEQSLLLNDEKVCFKSNGCVDMSRSLWDYEAILLK